MNAVPITDYASLAQAVLDFTHRASLSKYMAYLIQDAEDYVYQKVLELNEGKGLRWMETALNFGIDGTSGYAAVPGDYLSLKAAQVQALGGQFDLEQKDAQWIYRNYPVRSATAPPSYIAREGANFIFGPFPDGVYSVVGTYYQRAAGLSASNPTTWMVTNMPLTFHAACVRSGYKILKDLEAVQAWGVEFTDRITAVISADKAADLGSSPLVISPAGPCTSVY